ncbi:MAG: AtpZ/AtpI family protein [Bacteroidales bacterium]|nr:AtpZ/AtpI family protein [Bacteroidales bacterium]
MEKFDIKESWLVKVNQNIEKQNEEINSKDIKFFNLSILLDLARITQKKSYECDVCKTNKEIIMQMSIDSAEKINTIKGRNEITKNIDKISNHLRKEHKMFIKRYMLSVYTIIGLLIGLAIGFGVGYYFHTYKFFLLVGAGIGLIGGRVWGSIKERKLAKNSQLYGSF